MSVFRVKLQNNNQGQLDMDPSTHPLVAGGTALYGDLGESFGRHNPTSGNVSLQRQIFVAGPKRSYRLLTDGETFTDCNYWKQFAYPQVAEDRAFIEVLTDDGSVWSDIAEENTYLKGATETLSTDYADTVIDFVATYGSPAIMLQVQNLDDAIAISGELNGDTDVTFTLAAGAAQVFSKGEVTINKLRLKGDSGTPQASWIASLRSEAKS